MDEQLLIKHSFDLVHFPMYLKQRVAQRVRIVLTADGASADLMGFYTDDGGTRTTQYIKLVADEEGVVTAEDAFFHAVHAIFQSASTPPLKYIGFTRRGLPVYAPLFALAMLYSKYGRGLYEPGQVLPTPCKFLTVGYDMEVG
jgi:hypothetical protein